MLFKPHSENITLQHFATVEMADTWFGRGIAADGNTWTLLIYKDRVVGKKTVLKVQSSNEGRWKEGDPFWWQMYAAACVYMAILKIARHKYFGTNVTPADNLDATKENWDVVWPSEETLSTLEDHPQYQSMVKDFGLTLVPIQDGMRVEITVFAK